MKSKNGGGKIMDKIVEIFGKRLKIVQDADDGAFSCEECVIRVYCWIPICEDAKGNAYRHFEEVND